MLTQANHYESRMFRDRNEAFEDYCPETEEMSRLDYSQLRARTLADALYECRGASGITSIKHVLDVEPVYNDDSYQQMVFVPKTGAYRAWRWL